MPLMLLTRPVMSAYRFCAALSCDDDAPGKFAGVKRPSAGSPVTSAEVDLRDQARVAQPDVVLRPRHARRDVVVAAQPGDRVLDQQRRRVARLRRRRGAGVRRVAADRREVEMEAALVGERPAVHPDVQLLEERHRRAAVGHAGLVDQRIRERRAQRVAPAQALRALPRRDRKSGERRVTSVERVGRIGEVVVVERAREPVIRAHVVVDADGRIPAQRRDAQVVAEPLEVRVQILDRPGRADRAPDVAEQRRDDRVGARQLAVGRSERQQIDRPHRAPHVVAVDAALGARVQDGARARHVAGLPVLLVIDEEERLAASVEDARDRQRAAEPAAGLVLEQFGLVDLAAVVEPGVRVQLVVPVVVVEAALVVVGAGARRRT